jgi:hypothetical protein
MMDASLRRQGTSSIFMFPAPISFLDDDLKAELGMKAKKEKED